MVDTISVRVTSEMSLIKNLEIVDNEIKILKYIPGNIGVLINSKLQDVLDPGLNDVESIRDILSNKISTINLEVELNSSKISKMMYAPITSVDVECSFY